METELRPYWSRLFAFDWPFGLFLLLAVCVPRFGLVLDANVTGNYELIGLIMVLSALVPFVFLSNYGREQIGLVKPQNYRWFVAAFITGLISSLLLYLVGEWMYGNSYENWYRYIGKSYNIPNGVNPERRATLFGITAVTGMIFSPVGEEFFFRGIVHASVEKTLRSIRASLVDSAAFALTHIAHFGLVFVDNQWIFLGPPTLIWVSAMFLLSRLFLFFKKRSGSIWGAVVCHAAFNLGMTYYIFYPTYSQN
ncbi:MAG: CPBP family intramembrane metalloprotease [Cytophagales bacterium]|nr:MAG: CPBP family intramembrane metalloprotease [Cytophagales bacterium]